MMAKKKKVRGTLLRNTIHRMFGHFKVIRYSMTLGVGEDKSKFGLGCHGRTDIQMYVSH